MQFSDDSANAYLDANGNFDIEAYARDYVAAQAEQGPLNATEYTDKAEQERHSEDNMLYLSLFLVLALALLTLAPPRQVRPLPARARRPWLAVSDRQRRHPRVGGGVTVENPLHEAHEQIEQLEEEPESRLKAIITVSILVVTMLTTAAGVLAAIWSAHQSETQRERQQAATSSLQESVTANAQLRAVDTLGTTSKKTPGERRSCTSTRSR